MLPTGTSLLVLNNERYFTNISSTQHPEIYGSGLDGDEDNEDNEDNEDPTDQTERHNIPGDSINTPAPTDSTETPTNTTDPTDSPSNRSDAPTNTAAGKAHNSEHSGRPERTESTKQGTPASPVGTAKSDPTAGVTKDDDVLEGKTHSKLMTAREGMMHRDPKPAGPDTQEEGGVEKVAAPRRNKLEVGESERRGKDGT